jgi:hypothetical protein
MAPDHLSKAAPGPPFTWVAGSVGELCDMGRSWLLTPQLDALIKAVGGLDCTRGDDHQALRAWSSKHLDTRRNAERREAPAAAFPDSVHPRLIDAARALGLLTTPGASAHSYGSIIILGGATTGNALRTELAEQVARNTTGATITGLTSNRALSMAEHHSDPDSKNDHYEWVNLLRHMRARFGPLDQQGQDEAGGELRFTTAGRQTIRLLVAPQDRQGRRPGTAQQLSFFCHRTPATDRDSILLVTNAIYAPYQFFAGAPALLRNGSRRVELIGTSTTVNPATQLTYQRLAQEIHSAILASTELITTC